MPQRKGLRTKSCADSAEYRSRGSGGCCDGCLLLPLHSALHRGPEGNAGIELSRILVFGLLSKNTPGTPENAFKTKLITPHRPCALLQALGSTKHATPRRGGPARHRDRDLPGAQCRGPPDVRAGLAQSRNPDETEKHQDGQRRIEAPARRPEGIAFRLVSVSNVPAPRVAGLGIACPSSR